MSTEENKALIRRGYDALNERNWAAFDVLCALDFVWHNASTTMQGLEAYKQFLSMYLTAFPDLHFTIEDIIAEGDTVVVRQTGRGTNTDEIVTPMPLPATGKQVTASGITIVRVAGGKGVEVWSQTDTLGIMQQLGVIPSMG